MHTILLLHEGLCHDLATETHVPSHVARHALRFDRILKEKLLCTHAASHKLTIRTLDRLPHHLRHLVGADIARRHLVGICDRRQAS